MVPALKFSGRWSRRFGRILSNLEQFWVFLDYFGRFWGWVAPHTHLRSIYLGWVGTFSKLSVGVPWNAFLLKIGVLFHQGWRPGRTFAEVVGGILEMHISGWLNVIRHHTLDTRSDTEFKEPTRTIWAHLLFVPFLELTRRFPKGSLRCIL